MTSGDPHSSDPRPANITPADLKKLKQEVIRKFPPHHLERLSRPSEGAMIQSKVDWIAAAPAGVMRRHEVNVVRFPFDISASLDGRLPYTVSLDVELGADAGASSLVGRGLASDGIQTNLLLRVEPTDPTKADLLWWRDDGTDFCFAPLKYVGGKWKVMFAISYGEPGSTPLLFTLTFMGEVASP